MNISVENLLKEYDNKPVLNIDHHSIREGKIIGVVGANGAGKSTFIKILGGLEKPTRGRILYNGIQDFNKIYRDVTVVFQQPYLLDSTVQNNIAYPMKVRKYKKQDIKHRVDALMREMGIEDLKNQRANTLSGGEKQKVALARAVSFYPSLLLLDEPTANIDPNSMVVMEKMIKKINEAHKTTIIIVTHNLTQAKRLCDEVIVMNTGKIVEIGSVEQVMLKPQNPITRNLIHKELLD